MEIVPSHSLTRGHDSCEGLATCVQSRQHSGMKHPQFGRNAGGSVAPSRERGPGGPLALHPPVFRLSIELLGIEPPIWRSVQVPAGITLRRLHDIIQVVMGWDDVHMHLFEIGDVRYGMGDNEYDAEEVDDSKVLLGDVVHGAGAAFDYEYDFGDGWEHLIRVEEVRRDVPAAEVPRLLDGARACPPEDCGGVPGYMDLVEALTDPDHQDHESLLEWLGGDFDPEAFSVPTIDRRLASFRRAAGKKPAGDDRKRAGAGSRKAGRGMKELPPAMVLAHNLANAVDDVIRHFRLPEYVAASSRDLLMFHAQRDPDSFLGVRKHEIWIAAAIHAAFMIQPRSPFLPLPHISLEELARIFGVSTASVSSRSAELRRGLRR
jgi:hypothetical protein